MTFDCLLQVPVAAAEINLPQLQPGSSIMHGKVNPVIPEVTNQSCFWFRVWTPQ